VQDYGIRAHDAVVSKIDCSKDNRTGIEGDVVTDSGLGNSISGTKRHIVENSTITSNDNARTDDYAGTVNKHSARPDGSAVHNLDARDEFSKKEKDSGSPVMALGIELRRQPVEPEGVPLSSEQTRGNCVI
jgi:hypothetical protein